MTTPEAVAAQIEAAYDFRGHVTVELNDGREIVGFVFNRVLDLKDAEPFLELFVKDKDDRLLIAASAIRRIAITGKDFAQPFVPAPKIKSS